MPGGPDAGERVNTPAVVVEVVVAALMIKASDTVVVRLPLVPWICRVVVTAGAVFETVMDS